MKLKLESRHFLIIGKILCTIILLGIIFIWTIFLIVILPMIMFFIYHGSKKGQSNFKFSMAMIPAGVVAVLVFKLWSGPSKFGAIFENHLSKMYVDGMKRIGEGITHG